MCSDDFSLADGFKFLWVVTDHRPVRRDVAGRGRPLEDRLRMTIGKEVLAVQSVLRGQNFCLTFEIFLPQLLTFL